MCCSPFPELIRARNGAGGTVDGGLTARPPSTACRSGSLAWRPYFVAPPEGLIITQSLR